VTKQAQQLCEIAVEAARRGGALAMEHYQTDVEFWAKDDTTPVSHADLAVDALLHEQLLGKAPKLGWLSEETKDNSLRLSNSIVWVVDPIDGTRAFLKGRPEWVISIGAVKDNAPIAGAIFNPVTDEMFHATKEGGAFLNGEPIKARGRRQLEGSRMLGYKDMFAHPDWPQPWPEMDVSQVNAVAYRMALVACGRFDATLSLSFKNEWDTAAGTLIVQEAGGIVTDHRGDALTYNQPQTRARSLICTGPNLHDEILGRVKHIPDSRLSNQDR